MSFDLLFSSDHLIYRALENTPENIEHFLDVVLQELTSNDVDKTFSGATDAFLSVVKYLKQEGAEPTPDTRQLGGFLSTRIPSLAITALILWVSRFLQVTKGRGVERKPLPGLWAGHSRLLACMQCKFSSRLVGYIEKERNLLLVCFRRLAVFSFNERAVRLHERIREGANREAYYYDFKWHDRILFSILESEWADRKKS
jgi:hypothetical protein